MPVEPKQLELNGKKFTLSPLPAMRQYKLMTRLGKVAGPALRELRELKLGEIGKGTDPGKLEAGPFLGAAAALFEHLEADEAEAILRELLTGALVEGAPLLKVFDLELQGEMGTVLRLLAAALEVNFGSFFGGSGGGGIASFLAKLQRSGTSSTSPGPSNG
jgi:hypothetical protein